MEEQTTISADDLGMTKVRKGAIVSIVPLHGGAIQATVKGFAPLVFHPGKASVLNRARAQFKGWKSTLEDAAAVSAGDNGKTDPAEKHANIAALIQWFEAGGDDWNRKAARAPVDSTADVILALIRIGKADDAAKGEKILTWLAKKNDTDREGAAKALASAADVKATLLEIRAERERAKNPMNSDAILDGMEEDEGDGAEGDEE